jgi:hypothetical protein
MYTNFRTATLFILTAFFIATLSAQDSSLVGFWTFDDSTGIDSSLYGNNAGLYPDPVFVEGMKGSALYFDGVDDNIFIWDDNSLDTDSSMTIALWIMPDSVLANGSKVMSKWYSAPSQGDWLLSLSSKDSCDGDCVSWYFGFANYGVYGRNDGWFSIGPPHVDYFLKMGGWNLITVTFDTGYVNLYYNGDLIKTDTALVKYTSLGEYESDHIYAGKLWNGGYCFNGGLDEIRIYNRPLSAGEVKDLYEQVTAIDITTAGTKSPLEFRLVQNYPNPFNPSTTINYELSVANYVELNVYNLLGQKVVTLVNEKQAAGSYQVKWNASHYPSGIYYYKLEAGELSEVKKMILLR